MTDETDANPPSPASVPAAVPEPLVTKKNPLRLSLVWIVPILPVMHTIAGRNEVAPHGATFEDGYRAAEVCDAIVRSAENGRREAVTYR